MQPSSSARLAATDRADVQGILSFFGGEDDCRPHSVEEKTSGPFVLVLEGGVSSALPQKVFPIRVFFPSPPSNLLKQMFVDQEQDLDSRRGACFNGRKHWVWFVLALLLQCLSWERDDDLDLVIVLWCVLVGMCVFGKYRQKKKL